MTRYFDYVGAESFARNLYNEEAKEQGWWNEERGCPEPLWADLAHSDRQRYRERVASLLQESVEDFAKTFIPGA